MEFHLPKRIKTFYWRVFPVPFVWIAYDQIVHDWHLDQFGFDKLEDVGTLLFILGLTLPRVKPWNSEVLVRAQSISVLFKPSVEGVPSPLLRQTL